MIRFKSLMLTSAVIPAIALLYAADANAQMRGGDSRLAQRAAPTENADDAKRKPPQRQQQQRTTPQAKPSAPAAQQPRAPQRPAAQAPQRPDPRVQRPAQAPTPPVTRRPQQAQPQAQPATPRPGQPQQRPAQPRQVPAAQQQPARPGAPAPQQRREQQIQQRQPQQPPAVQGQPPRGPAAVQTPQQRRPDQAVTPARPQPVQPPATTAQPQRIDQLRSQRQEERRDGRTFIREGDRTIVREGNRTIIQRNEGGRFGRNASNVRTERRGNETFNIAARPNGIQIITVTDNNGRLVRRVRRDAGGREVIIIDNRFRGAPAAGNYFVTLPPPRIRIPRERYIVEAYEAPPALIYETLIAPPVDMLERRYTLDEIRYSPDVRDRMPRIDLDTVTFDTGSWEVAPDQIDRLEPIATAMLRAIERNPAEVYLIEGHTDAVGDDLDNLSLSDRRAESVAVILTDVFGVPPENLTTQGYGEEYLKIATEAAERRNRRVTVRRITPLLGGEGMAAVPPQ